MTWRLFWELLALFVVVVGAKNKANWSWYHGRLGSFIFWAVIMLGSIAGMVLVAR